MKKPFAVAAALTALAAGVVTSIAIPSSRGDDGGIAAFTPIAGSAYGQVEDQNAPWVIPAGFQQRTVSDNSDLDIYDSLCAGIPGLSLNPESDWPDMTVANETGRQAGRYLYRTHEVRPFLYSATCAFGVVTPEAKAAYIADGGGAVSVIDTKTGVTKVIAQRGDWDALDGLVWTPWGTLLFAEETLATELADPEVPAAQSGLLYELAPDRNDPTKAASVKVRPLLGALAHEGIEVDQDGNVYVIDEDRRGSIYRFVPTRRGDLSKGTLQVLKVDAGKTGSASWVNLDMNQVQVSARVAAAAAGGTQFCRPEDMDRIGRELYVALTCEDVTNAANINGPGAVLSITLGSKPNVKYFVAPGVNVPAENAATSVTGFRAPDNLANGPDGSLWIVEDNAFSDIWVASKDRNGDGAADQVRHFASLKDAGAEGTGIYFNPKDPKTLYVNIQHATSGNDATIAISRARRGRD